MTLRRRRRVGSWFRCSGCRVYKPKSEFYQNASRLDGISSWCAQCLQEQRHGRSAGVPCRLVVRSLPRGTNKLWRDVLP